MQKHCWDLHRIGRTRRSCRWRSNGLSIVLFVLVLLCTTEGNDTEGAMPELVARNLEESNSVAVEAIPAGAEGSTSVKRLWGVADTTAAVGKLFQYHIPSDAFAGPVNHFEVLAAGSTDLPLWLRFNRTTAILEGVPTESDLGQHYITVKAVGLPMPSGEISQAKDVFSIDVMPATHESSAVPLKTLASGDEVLKCDIGESVTKMALAVDADMYDMKPEDRIRLLTKIANYIRLEKELLRLLPRKKDNLLDASAIIAGPGNIRQVTTAGAVVQWQVGCGGKIEEAKQDLLKQVEYAARNGTLASVIGVPIVGWHIATHSTSLSRRAKRHLYMGYSTPVPALLPTRHTTFPDDYNWDMTDRENQAGYEEDLQPESRIVPTMASPIFTEPTYYPTYYNGNPHNQQHHKHQNHRSKTKGRHAHNHHGASRFHPQVAVYGTPVPTPAVYPIKPTATAEEPSRAYVEEGTVAPPFGHTDHLQSSMYSTPTYHILTDALPTHSDTDDSGSSEEIVSTRRTYPPTEQNLKPAIRQRVEKLAFYAGKVFRHTIPKETFRDAEDGDTRNLKLFLLHTNGSALSQKSWIQFDDKKQDLYGLPLKENIGSWQFILEAMDSQDASVREHLDIMVVQPLSDRKVNHEFTFNLTYDTYELINLVDRNILLVKKLQELYGETGPVNETRITVKSATKDSFTWSNDTLLQQACPHNEIEQVYSALVVSKSELTPELHEIMQPEFRQVRVRVKYLGHCKGHVTSIPTSVTPGSTKPKLRNPIDVINATAGEFLMFPIPEDTFYDQSQGLTSSLLLELKTGSSAKLKPSDWIRYDSSYNALVGLPMPSDIGTHKYHLVATNRDKGQNTEVFVIEVHPRPAHQKLQIEFCVVLDYDFRLFQSDLSNKVKVLDKLQRLYGDKDTRYITVLAFNEGSVRFSWTNNSLPDKPCPKEEIGVLLKYLFTDNMTVSKQLVSAFQPEFNVSEASIIPGNACLGAYTPTSVSAIPAVTVETEHATSDDDVYISTIIPAVVIAAMLLIAAIVACILYRKKRKGKMTMEDNSTFINKGIPIIFADELEDKVDPAKAPMIMKEEKPPLPPPEYPRASSGSSSPSTPPLDRKDHLERSAHHHPRQQHYPSASNLEHSENSPLYQPPPPFTTNRENRMNRPKPTPTYRMPPPYVPP